MNGDICATRQLGWAITLSILVHVVVLQLMPLLEQYKPKPINTIMAEFSALPPPQQQMPETPQSTPPQPEVTQPTKPVIKQPQPTQREPDSLPVLQSKSEEHPDDYAVQEISTEAKPDHATSAQQQMEPTAPATHVVTSSSESLANTSVVNTWDENAYNEYGRSLQRLCERNKKYPAIAIRRNWQGGGSVLVKFSAGGELLSVVIEQSTGQNALDDQAIEMVKKSLANLPLPTQMKGREFKISVPVDFKLE